MVGANSEPTFMPLDLLREITDGFSEERKLGSGSYGKVYLGVHQDGKKIAVKMLYDMPGLDDQQFKNEFKNLTRLRHQNIVRLVGYCYDIQEVQVMHEGRLVLAERTHRALCLEYMSKGSLENYLSDECDRYDWHTCYGIIKGICQGLNCLHTELKPPIYHLDLKPANVLLDENMVPRIADFGMSRLFRDEHTRATKSSFGTIGYLPPEYICNSLISNKFDIFSLGVVIIKIMAGRAGYFNSAEMPSREFTDLVQKKWKNRLHETLNLREAYSEQIKICIEIGLSCVQEDRHRRPSIQDIVDRLNETVAKCTYAARKDMLLICQNSLGTITQPEKIYNPNHRQATPSRKDPSSSYNMEAIRNSFPQRTQDPNVRHAKKIYHGSTLTRSDVSENLEGAETQTSQEPPAEWGPEGVPSLASGLDDANLPYPYLPTVLEEPSTSFSEVAEDDPLPAINGLRITGEAFPGRELQASGYSINGTTSCNFEWVRHLEDGSVNYIEGTKQPTYLVTADDVDSLLAIEVQPLDDRKRKGEIVKVYANEQKKITCDPEMKEVIKKILSIGHVSYEVLLPVRFIDMWEFAVLAIKREGYSIKCGGQRGVAITEKFQQATAINIPYGHPTEFSIQSADGAEYNLKPGENSPSRDSIVLILRLFRMKAVEKSKGRKKGIFFK